MAATGDTFAVLGSGPYGYTGAAVLYERSGSTWKKLRGSIEPKLASGYNDSIALSGDGRTLFYGLGGSWPDYRGAIVAYKR